MERFLGQEKHLHSAAERKRQEWREGKGGRLERRGGHGTHITPPLEQGDGAELPVPSRQPQTQRLDPPACLHVCVCLLCLGVKATSLLFAPPPAFAQPTPPPSNELLAFCSVTTTARITVLESPETSSKWKCQPLTSANRWNARLPPSTPTGHLIGMKGTGPLAPQHHCLAAISQVHFGTKSR